MLRKNEPRSYPIPCLARSALGMDYIRSKIWIKLLGKYMKPCSNVVLRRSLQRSRKPSDHVYDFVCLPRLSNPSQSPLHEHLRIRPQHGIHMRLQLGCG